MTATKLTIKYDANGLQFHYKGKVIRAAWPEKERVALEKKMKQAQRRLANQILNGEMP